MAALKSRPAAAALAWSPLGPYLAAGSAAGAIDVTFSSASSLEVFAVDLASDSPDLLPASSSAAAAASAPERFASLAWGTAGSSSSVSEAGGAAAAAHPEGVIAGGLADGSIALWDAASFVSSSASSAAAAGAPLLLARLAKHAGPVPALQFNAGSPNLLASGGGDGELCIWDVAAPARPTLYPSLRAGGGGGAGDPSASAPLASPMASGGTGVAALAPPGSEVTSLAWNCKVPHILASATAGGVATVWDLKKQRPVIALKGSAMQGRRASAVAWSPDQATQVAVACEDDAFPVVQLWDLRNATAPVGELGPFSTSTSTSTGNGSSSATAAHSRGITSLAWCPHDAALLATGARDGRVVLWDAEAFAPLGETAPLASSSSVSQAPHQADQFGHHHHHHASAAASVVSSLEWCPSTPGVFAAATLSGAAPGGGLVSVCSLAAFAVPRGADASQQQQGGAYNSYAPQTPSPTSSLSRAPAWMRRPCGVSFGYGGRFASFSAVAERTLTAEVPAGEDGSPATTATMTVPPNTVVVSRAPPGLASGLPADAVEALEASLGDGSDRAALAALCDARASVAASASSSSSFAAAAAPSEDDGGDGEAWSLLRALFEEDPRALLLQRLGFADATASPPPPPPEEEEQEEEREREETAAPPPPLATAASSSSSRPATAAAAAAEGDGASFFDSLAEEQQQQAPPAAAAAAGGAETPRGPSTSGGAAASADLAAFGGLSLASTPSHFPGQFSRPSPDDDRIQRALLVGNYEAAVDACLRSGGPSSEGSGAKGERDADALVIASLAPPPQPGADGSTPPSLWARTVTAVSRRRPRPYSKLLSALAGGDLAALASAAPLESWRATLAALASYAPAGAFAPLADDLARRLAADPSGAFSHAAACAWVCAGNVDAAVRHWAEEAAARAGVGSGGFGGGEGGSGSDAFAAAGRLPAAALHSVVERGLVLALGARSSSSSSASSTSSPVLSALVGAYADLLAADGAVEAAAKLLNLLPQEQQQQLQQQQAAGDRGDDAAAVARDRLARCGAGAGGRVSLQAPFPFLGMSPPVVLLAARAPVETVTTATAAAPVAAATAAAAPAFVAPGGGGGWGAPAPAAGVPPPPPPPPPPPSTAAAAPFAPVAPPPPPASNGGGGGGLFDQLAYTTSGAYAPPPPTAAAAAAPAAAPAPAPTARQTFAPPAPAVPPPPPPPPAAVFAPPAPAVAVPAAPVVAAAPVAPPAPPPAPPAEAFSGGAPAAWGQQSGFAAAPAQAAAPPPPPPPPPPQPQAAVFAPPQSAAAGGYDASSYYGGGGQQQQHEMQQQQSYPPPPPSSSNDGGVYVPKRASGQQPQQVSVSAAAVPPAPVQQFDQAPPQQQQQFYQQQQPPPATPSYQQQQQMQQQQPNASVPSTPSYHQQQRPQGAFAPPAPISTSTHGSSLVPAAPPLPPTPPAPRAPPAPPADALASTADLSGVGDPELRRACEALRSLCSAASAAAATAPGKRREADDNERRLGALLWKVANDSGSTGDAPPLVSARVSEGVSRLGAAVAAGDWDAAASVQHALAASDWDECAQWLTAVKRLVKARQAGR